ncbi:glycosyltransferase family 2 protein [Serratia aquatilis]|uniref:Glycosyltransferase family 2 protein n=1 Tax=Serratia aquatilis TaxID=1737515 RepID=A0ABV6EJV7_9GAMM
MPSISSLKVSIYISTHNRLEKLKRAVNSVLEQDYENIEILICDDASTDGTKEFSEKLSCLDSRVVYLRNEKNQGACATRNLGINHASGYFITGLDDDDVFYKDRISFFVTRWSNEYSFLACNFVNRSPESETVHYRRKKEKVFSHLDLLFTNEASNQVFTLTERLRDIGGFDTRARRLQDWDTWLRLSYKYGNFIRYPEIKYVMYHDHAVNESRVSNSYSFNDALFDMCQRNKSIYGDVNSVIIEHIIALDKGELRLSGLVNWFFISKSPSMIAKFLYAKLLKK